MYDALLVRRFQGLGDLLGDGQCLFNRDRATGNALREILAFDEFHHQSLRATGSLETVNRGDVRMVQRRERLGFPLEACESLSVLGERIGQDFDRHLAAKAGVGSAVNHAHAAFADPGGDFEDAEARAGTEGQAVGV